MHVVQTRPRIKYTRFKTFKLLFRNFRFFRSIEKYRKSVRRTVFVEKKKKKNVHRNNELVVAKRAVGLTWRAEERPHQQQKQRPRRCRRIYEIHRVCERYDWRWSSKTRSRFSPDTKLSLLRKRFLQLCRTTARVRARIGRYTHVRSLGFTHTHNRIIALFTRIKAVESHLGRKKVAFEWEMLPFLLNEQVNFHNDV